MHQQPADGVGGVPSFDAAEPTSSGVSRRKLNSVVMWITRTVPGVAAKRAV